METFCYETKEGVTYGYFPVLREMGFENAFTCMEGGESAILPHTLNMALHRVKRIFPSCFFMRTVHPS